MSNRQKRRERKQRRHTEVRPTARAAMSRRRRLAAAGGLTIGATVAMGGVAHADPFTVSSLGDSLDPGTLRKAITDANGTAAPDTITFDSGLSGTIHTLGLVITAPVDIQGPGPSQITIDGDNDGGDPDFYLIPAYSGPVTISGLTITGGKAAPGGGIFTGGTPLTVANTVITGNTATGASTDPRSGGGIRSVGANLTLLSSTVSGNTATGPGSPPQGGGVYFNAGTLTIQNSTVSGNTADQSGGILVMDPAPGSVIQNSTFSGNHADYGAGIRLFLRGSDGFTIQGSTIAGNTGTGPGSSGGGIASDSPTLNPVLQDTIVSGNTATASPDLYSYGTLDSAFSLIGSTSGATIHETVPGSDITGVDPQLGALADNGGPTQTMALAATSAAVDKGSAFGLTTDQRGLARPFDVGTIPNSTAAGADGSDIGAFELQASEIPPGGGGGGGGGGTTVKCAGKTATLVGTAGKDILKGTAKADVIAGLGGNDKVSGLGGKDIVCGGAGKDTELGGAGKDTLLGQKGNDKLLGGGGADTLKGGPGTDNLVGGASHDKLVGGPGKDKVKQ
jgi:hypothetical protein